MPEQSEGNNCTSKINDNTGDHSIWMLFKMNLITVYCATREKKLISTSGS